MTAVLWRLLAAGLLLETLLLVELRLLGVVVLVVAAAAGRRSTHRDDFHETFTMRDNHETEIPNDSITDFMDLC